MHGDGGLRSGGRVHFPAKLPAARPGNAEAFGLVARAAAPMPALVIEGEQSAAQLVPALGDARAHDLLVDLGAAPSTIERLKMGEQSA